MMALPRATATGSPISILPKLREHELARAFNSFSDADFDSPDGRNRIVEHVTRALLAFERERNMLPEGARRFSARRIEAMVRVALDDVTAASCA